MDLQFLLEGDHGALPQARHLIQHRVALVCEGQLGQLQGCLFFLRGSSVLGVVKVLLLNERNRKLLVLVQRHHQGLLGVLGSLLLVRNLDQHCRRRLH
jgi:hypothetical protein